MNQYLKKYIPYRHTSGSLIMLLVMLSVWMLPSSETFADVGESIVISELMPSNDKTLADEDGDFSDWIELYNSGNVNINLSGLYLTDDPNNLTKWALPILVLPAREHLLIFASGKDRATGGSQLHTNFKLSNDGEYLALVKKDKEDGTTIAWEYDPYPYLPSDLAYGLDANLNARYFATPTPGMPNPALGPILSSPSHMPAQPTNDASLTVNVAVTAALAPIDEVQLHYRVMFGETVTIPMLDDGLHEDGAAGDGLYGATIPSAAYQSGEMVRYAITATDSESNPSRWPLFHDATNSPEYLGTMVADPTVESPLATLYWFVEDPAAAEIREGTRASVFYEGRFYDNIFVRLRGISAAQWPKKSFKFDFNSGHHFTFDDAETPVEELNLNSTYSDKAYLRQMLSWESYRDTGSPHSISFMMRVQQNGSFHSVLTFIEQPDERYLTRQGMDPNGALYKLYNPLDSATEGVEKRTRLDEDNSDLQALIDGISQEMVEDQMAYVYDHVNIPAVLNYVATAVLLQDLDGAAKNYYLYRDTEGNREWEMLPWDKDLTFGRNWVEGDILNDTIWADHDFESYPITLDWNHLIGIMINDFDNNPVMREMYLRRLRSLMDEHLQPPDTPAEQLKYEQRIDELVSELAPDIALDAAMWSLDWGEPQNFTEAIEILKSDYLAVRRQHLFVTHGPPSAGIIPDSQGEPPVNFDHVEFDPDSGNPEEEYLTLHNPNSYAVDISNWTISGDIDYTFQPGVVIPAGGTLYISPDVVAFRNRATSPRGGESLFVQGDYQGNLGNSGGTLQLHTTEGTLAAEITFGPPEKQSALAGNVIISEMNYNPPDEGGTDGGEFEFIELKNVSTDTIGLDNARFVDGIDFIFPATTELTPNETLVLIRNPSAFASRYPDVEYAGIYTGRLRNSGESLRLTDNQDATITTFAYDDGYPWPISADGDGYTLVRREPIGDPNDPCRWRASTNLYGSPGGDDPAGGSVICDSSIPIEPASGTTLTYDDTQGHTTTITIPASSVETPVTLTYTEEPSVVTPPDEQIWVERAFTLNAYQNGDPVPALIFQEPLTTLLSYTDEDIRRLLEESLTLYMWNGTIWQPAANSCPTPHVSLDQEANQLEIDICELGTFALFGESDGITRIFLPMLSR